MSILDIFLTQFVEKLMEGKKVTQFTWTWNLNYKFQLETSKIQILYKKIGTDTLITCKPKMVSIVSINCKFGATEVARQGSLKKTLVFNFYVGIYY